MGEKWSSYEEWVASLPEALTSDDIWNFYAYRKALFFYELGWCDCEKMFKHPLGKPIAHQLIRSVGSIAANIEEGYGRGFQGRERTQFLRIALGSARESKGWYFRAKNMLQDRVLDHRLALCNEVIALIVTEIKRIKTNNQK